MTQPAPDAVARRQADLVGSLAAVRRRLAAAAESAGRRPDELTLVAVTKTFPVTDVRLLAAIGVRDIGENRDREARAKAAACADLDLRWHFVGRLQTNKCRSIAQYADEVHAVDRAAAVTALQRGAERAARVVGAFVQVSLDGDPARGGAVRSGVPAVADAIAAASNLRLRGVRAVAPRGADSGRWFEVLADVAAEVRRNHPQAHWVSAGMSGDLEAAVAAGATHVRIGTALLGGRAAGVR